ncbi:MAG: AAA family ATPase [Candidatus Woesearchaeota archaeon]
MYIVTGTPGTGKTTFAKKYAKEHAITYIDGNVIIDENNLSEGIDPETKSLIVDEKKFAVACHKRIREAKKNKEILIIDSHLSHYINSKYVTTCFVTECDLKVLKKRLEKRKYSKQKITDNLEAETFKVCRIDAKEIGHTIEIIDTTE